MTIIIPHKTKAMKNLIYFLILFPVVVLGQVPNYVKTTVYKSPYGKTATASTDSITETITYFDGLGRAMQQVAGRQSGNGYDLATHIEYDSCGRQAREYLPYETGSATLGFDDLALPNTVSFYSDAHNGETTANPYSQKFFEASPLNRILKQAAPGNDWVGDSISDDDHTVRFRYKANDSLEVRLFKAVTTWNSSTKRYDAELDEDGHYAKGTLFKTITRDENATTTSRGQTEEFKDLQGRIVLKRVFGLVDSSVTAHDTYYVYDDYGNLSFVIPPLAASHSSIEAPLLEKYCYQYIYDGRNRMTEKKLPGKDWEFIVYDKLDRVTMTGPAYDPFGSGTEGWLFTKYDAFGRIVYTGWHVSDASTSRRNSFQAEFDDPGAHPHEGKLTSAAACGDSGMSIFYSNDVFPTSGYKILTVNYYDDYTGLATSSGDFTATPGGEPVFYNNSTLKPKGLPTGSWTRAITGTSVYGTEAKSLFDKKARPIRTYSTNWLGGFTQVDSNLDFTGKTL